MLKVKPIPFPSFDDWILKHDSYGYPSWKCNRCDFWFEVEMYSFGRDSVTYAFAIAACDVPSNVYVDKVFWSSYQYEYPTDEDSSAEVARKKEGLRSWYESTAEEANKQWAEYITQNYLIDEEDS